MSEVAECVIVTILGVNVPDKRENYLSPVVKICEDIIIAGAVNHVSSSC